jgi:hypothetical protein
MILKSGRYIHDKRGPEFAYDRAKAFLLERKIPSTLIRQDGWGHIWVETDLPWNIVLISAFLKSLGLYVAILEGTLLGIPEYKGEK